MMRILSALTVAAALAFVSLSPANAVTIEPSVSPKGIKFWLVRDKAVPLTAMSYAFRGGASQDPTGKSGTGNLVADTLDEGAGELDSKAFHEKMERQAIELSFNAGRDEFQGSLRTLNENRDEAFGLLNLALSKPRFDTEAVERVRAQEISGLRRDTTNPNTISSQQWFQTAFPDHPYGRESKGSLESVPNIAISDLRDFTKRVFARNGLTVSIVGDVDPKSAGELIDRAFGDLPEKNDLRAIPDVKMAGLGRRIVTEVNVPQAVITFGGVGLQRKDPDFMAAYIVNHVLGGGTFSSRLYREVREKRGLAYGVSESLVWYRHAALYVGGTATRADRTAEALSIIEAETKRMAEEGPTEEEFAAARDYLKGAYALSLDTSSKIAGQLTQIQLDDLGIDYMTRRATMIDSVTLADAKRVAKRIYGGGMLVTVAGKPKGLSSSTQ